MSELRVAEIHNPNDQTGGITIDNDDNVSINGSPIGNQGALGNRNLIINGAMQIAQRGNEETGVTTTGYRTCDRFRVTLTTLGTWNVFQSTLAPNGFANSLRMQCTTANASPAEAANCFLSYRLEGFDCQRLLDTGTTTHPMRLSFWVRSNRTGDASVALIQADNSDRMFSASYNIAAANTWEHKVIEIPSDASADFDNDNERSLQIDWWLNSGPNFTGGTHSPGWVDFDQTARNATNLGVGGTVNDDFCLTGVQLETGEAATPFEHRPIGTELALCQRYCLQLTAQSSGFRVLIGSWQDTQVWGTVFTPPVPMRTLPTSFEQGPGAGINDNWMVTVNGGLTTADDEITAWQSASGETNGNTIRLSIDHNAVGTAGATGQLRAGVNNAFIRFNAEL